MGEVCASPVPNEEVGLIVVRVVVGWWRWWHGQRGGHVKGVAGNRATGRVAADFRIGEEGFGSVTIDRGDRDVEAVARIEAEGLGGDGLSAGMRDHDALTVKVFVDGAGGDNEVIDEAVFGSFESQLNACDGVAAGIEFGWSERRAGKAR